MISAHLHQQHVRPGTERGQVLVIVGLGLTALIAMVGLVMDGGHAWGRQRETQNAADATAEAGTVVIQQKFVAEAYGEVPPTDGDVGCAVRRAADANDVVFEGAVYTDAYGTPLSPELAVGDCAPGGGGGIRAEAQGVQATTSQSFDTFLVRVVGIDQLETTADATAVVGAYGGHGNGPILPITIPLTFTTCDSLEQEYVVGEGAWAFRETEAERTAATLVTIPLCDQAPGSVGWLDYGCRPNLEQMITDPCRLSIPIPDWLHTQSGNVNNLETLIREYTGPSMTVPDDAIVSLPIHTNTCDVDPGGSDRCPPAADDDAQWSGNGDNLYYYVTGWVGFMVDQAHTSGGDQECQQDPGTPKLVNPIPAGKVGCVKGWFTSEITPGPILIGPIDTESPGEIGVTLVE